MFFNDQFYHQRLVELTRDPTSVESRIWIGVALAAHSDPRGVKLLHTHFEQCLRLGEPLYALWALLAIKTYAPLSPIQNLFQRLAQDQAQREMGSTQYVLKSQETQDSGQVDPEEPSGLITALEGEELISQAHAVALDWSALEDIDSRQNILPLLSSFDEMILSQLLSTLELKSLTPGELMIEEGEEADGVYWLSAGRVEVTRRNQDKETITLAQLDSGSIIGEMGLITKSPRVATVTATTDAQAIVLPSQAYALLDAYSDRVHQTLSHLVGRRMLENLTKFSPVFKALPPQAHPELLSQFKAKVVPGGEVLLRQGKPGRGLYLILDGLVQVTQLGSIQSKWLREGDIFGEISLVYDSPVSATCTAARRSLLYMLDPDRFKVLVSQYPEIKHTLAELSLFRNLDELYMMT